MKSTAANKEWTFKYVHKGTQIKRCNTKDIYESFLLNGWEKGKGLTAWNKGLTKETDERVKKYVDSQTGKHLSEQTKKKLSELNKGKKWTKDAIEKRTATRKVTVPHLKEETKQKISNSLKGHKVSEEVIAKIKQKLSGRKGHPCSEAVKQKISKHNSSKEFQEYQREIKRKNHSFNTSQPELSAKSKLESLFGTENVFYQYSNSKYPFSCDFYIKPKDLYIECNFHWTHGPHPFDKNNPEDIELLNKIKQKQDYYVDSSGHKKKNFYYLYEKIWTIKDPEKLNYAKNSCLNYLVFYKLKDFETWFEGVATDVGLDYDDIYNF